MVDQIYEDFIQSAKLFPHLRSPSFLIAGFVHARTGLSLKTLFRLLGTFEACSPGDNPSADPFIKALLLGNLAEAKRHLNKLRDEKEAFLKSSFSVTLPQDQTPGLFQKSASVEAVDPSNVILRKKTHTTQKRLDTIMDDPEVDSQRVTAKNSTEMGIDQNETEKPIIIKRKAAQKETPNLDKQSAQLATKLSRQKPPPRPVAQLLCAICQLAIETGAVCLGNTIVHKQCLVAALQDQISAGSYILVCPFDNSPLSEIEYKQLLDKHWIGKLDENSLRQYMRMQDEQIIECPLCQAPIQAHESVSKFQCPNCKVSSCLRCKVRYHFRLTCEEFQEQAKACPKCKQLGECLCMVE